MLKSEGDSGKDEGEEAVVLIFLYFPLSKPIFNSIISPFPGDGNC